MDLSGSPSIWPHPTGNHRKIMALTIWTPWVNASARSLWFLPNGDHRPEVYGFCQMGTTGQKPMVSAKWGPHGIDLRQVVINL